MCIFFLLNIRYFFIFIYTYFFSLNNNYYFFNFSLTSFDIILCRHIIFLIFFIIFGYIYIYVYKKKTLEERISIIEKESGIIYNESIIGNDSFILFYFCVFYITVIFFLLNLALY